MTDRELKLEEALIKIYQWCMAYPHSVFTPLSEDQIVDAGRALTNINIDIGALHAEWARHLLDGIGEIAKEGLEP